MGSAIVGGGGGDDWGPRTYVEELDVVEDMVIVGKVVGGDDVDAGILLDLPVGETEPLGLGEELILGELASPVGLVGLFEITEDTNAALGGGLAFGVWIPEDSEKAYGNPNTEEDTILTVVARRDSLLLLEEEMD